MRIIAIIVLTALAACSAGEPLEYTAADEIRPGPGLVSGPDGKFTLYRAE